MRIYIYIGGNLLDALQIHFIKISLVIFFIALGILYLAYRIFTGKIKVAQKKNNVAKILSKILGGYILGVGIFILITFGMDNICFTPKNITVTTIDIWNIGGIRFVYRTVLMDDKVNYTLFFNDPYIEEGKTYKITYMPTTKVILRAVEVNNKVK